MSTEVFRILDANLNRLREALRVVEEYFRFILNNEKPSVALKQLRHALVSIEHGLGADKLLDCRSVEDDCFAHKNRPEELERESPVELARANFKRAQEASRVIEEYSKVAGHSELSEKAKSIRFTLYTLEKEYMR